MAQDITVPDLGDFKDVEVIDVLVKPGDKIEVDTPLITLETEKATMDVPAPVYVGLLLSAEYQHESPISEVRCGFDQVREAPYLVADWFVPRVELESGSMVLGRIRSADSRDIRFDSVFDPAPVSTGLVRMVRFVGPPLHPETVRASASAATSLHRPVRIIVQDKGF
jgi:hypothetical protein